MHIEMTQFVNNLTELWHFNCWAFSIWTTSDHYAHYTYNKTLIFFSDFVQYMCLKYECFCHWKRRFHLDRVLIIAQNHQFSTEKKEVITLKVQIIIHLTDLSQNVRDNVISLLLETEIVVIEDIFMFLSEFSVLYWEIMKLDYVYDSQVELSTQQQAQ